MNTQEIKVTNAQTIRIDAKMQEKSVIPTTEEQIVLPDLEFTGLSKVIVEKIPENYVEASVENETLMLSRTMVVEDGVIL